MTVVITGLLSFMIGAASAWAILEFMANNLDQELIMRDREREMLCDHITRLNYKLDKTRHPGNK